MEAGRELEEAACSRAVCEKREVVEGKMRLHTVHGKNLSLWVNVPEARPCEYQVCQSWSE